ncbi:amidohydrolase [Seminavis robusta]|uniref:Amidohydrolase n=1 Tax=Seminavis robusta TaxID=568900 RepID=A0A9N8E766_9STRA|nr:amidohydrolase [Seminavis robusta]|eukprot:Sro618_g176220.1 amidohydrolase (449) ;mRNA; r:22249-23780
MVFCCYLHDGALFLPPEPTPKSDFHIFSNVDVFDGENEALIKNQDVAVLGNKIHKIAPTGTLGDVPDNAIIIDGTGHVLMPGLIDVHWHTLMANMKMEALNSSEISYTAIVAAAASKETLLRGFTTVRDAGGNSHPIKKAIDQGEIEGPRIYPSGAFICQTSGHFDFRDRNATPTGMVDSLDYFARNNFCQIADGVPEVLKRTREQLRIGATQIKIAAGGGVSSSYDPLDVTEYTVEEIKAAVDCAEAWNTYVLAHVFNDRGIMNCIEGGVKSIEHGFFASDEVLQVMKEKGVWLSLQPLFADEDGIQFPPGSIQKKKYEDVCSEVASCFARAKKIGVKIAFGTDVLFDKGMARKQGKMLSKLQAWFTPFEVLKMATSNNAELCKLCGPRDTYPGQLGVVKEGALADLILTKGNPLADINIVANADDNFMVIMKDGKICKGDMTYEKK